MLRILAVVTALMIVSSSGATITADHVLWDSGTLPESGEEFFTVRLQVHVTTTPGHTDGDDWTSASLRAHLDGGIFYQNPLGGNPPNPAFFGLFPDMEYDSYFTSPADYPNTTYDGTIIGIATPGREVVAPEQTTVYTLVAFCGGTIVQVGVMAGGRTEFDVGALMPKRATLKGTVLRARPIEEKIALTQQFEAEMVPLIASGVMAPTIDSRYPLDRIAEAHARMEANANAGKLVIDVGWGTS